jgi:ABC-2 type transport system ATP-binding protein
MPGMDTSSAVVVDGLTKRYGSHTVVDRLAFHIPDGAVTGLVGPNGAGKTTALRMLLGLVRPDGGTATVHGASIGDPERYLPGVGALVEGPAFYPGLSGRRNLIVYATLAGIALDQVPVVLERMGLAARGGDAYRTYSLGLRQRLGIAAALLGAPRLVVLDEPTNGLDPAGIRDMRAIIRSINEDGRTVLVTSHLLHEIQQVCSWLIVISDGRVRYQGELGDIDDLEERYFQILQGEPS